MILPTTYATALMLMIVTMLCWGSWANTFKLAGKWRFELFYYDYSIGVLIMALVIGLTFGSLGPTSFELVDDLLASGYRKIAYALAAGVVFNLANMLLVAAIAVAGMSVAFPIGIGLALIIGVVWNYILQPQGNPMLLFLGVALVLGAIIVDAIAYRRNASRPEPDDDASEAAKPEKKGKKAEAKKRKAAKGIILSVVCGVLMGSFYPLVQMSREGGIGSGGLGPYAVSFLFAIGVFVSTFVFNLYFLNLPVQGKPISIGAYFHGSFKQHLLGILGGLIWCAGAIANFVASEESQGVHVGPAISYAFGQGATMVSALWGVFLWKEFAGASKNVRLLLALMFILFTGGLALISVAPVFWTPK